MIVLLDRQSVELLSWLKQDEWYLQMSNSLLIAIVERLHTHFLVLNELEQTEEEYSSLHILVQHIGTIGKNYRLSKAQD